MAEFIPVEPFDLVIFGGTGDLARRKLLPALYHRWLDGQIPAASRIVGSARGGLDQAAYQAFAEDACRTATDAWDEASWAEFAALLDYVVLDATDPDADWAGLKTRLASGGTGRPCVFYLATAPRLYVPICDALGRAGLAPSSARVVLEKPIGADLASARAINDGVGAVFCEDCVFRIDH